MRGKKAFPIDLFCTFDLAVLWVQPVPQVLPSDIRPHIDTAKTIGILTVQVTTGVPERAGLTSKNVPYFSVQVFLKCGVKFTIGLLTVHYLACL